MIVLLVAAGCSDENHKTIQKEPKSNEKQINQPIETSFSEKSIWVKDSVRFFLAQDSLRNILIEKNGNTVLQESIIQEMYIRGIAQLVNNILHFNIFFDIHGLDCGAPDCYNTELYFSFGFNDKLIFPKKLSYVLHEYGCIEDSRDFNDVFELKFIDTNKVIYSCPKQKCTLVLFKSKEESGDYAFFFDDVEENEVNSKNVLTILNNQEEGAIIPYKSWELTTNEYKVFFSKYQK